MAMDNNSLQTNQDIFSLLDEMYGYIPGAVRFAYRQYRLNASKDEIDDICQDIAILLIDGNCRRLRSFAWRSSPKSWLHAIVKRYVGHCLRRRVILYSLDDIDPNTLKYFSDQDQAVYSQELHKRLAAALDHLPNRSRALIELSIAGYSDAEIGSRLGMAKDIVRGHRHELKRKLKILCALCCSSR